MCTKICTIANPRMTKVVAVELANTLSITSQNGIAVRMTESTNPVTYPPTVMCIVSWSTNSCSP